MKNSNLAIIGVLVLVVIVLFAVKGGSKKAEISNEPVKVGIISDFTGPAAFWGVPTQLGAELAEKDLEAEGYNVEIIFESYPLDPADALSAAQKLVNVDKVDAVYTEFNPGAVSVGSFLKDKDILHIFTAAAVSPLEQAPLAYKTYLDYEAGCRAVAERFKDEGAEKIGYLEVNQEFGSLCLEGIKSVYGDDVIYEGYNLGDTDFRTQLGKIQTAGATAVMNVGFEGDTYNTLKVLKELGYPMRYGTVDDSVTEKVRTDFAENLKGGYGFGFAKVDTEFSERLRAENGGAIPGVEQAAALSYLHIRQMVEAISECRKDYDCVVREIDNAPKDSIIGFNQFKDHIADLDVRVVAY